MTRLSTTETTDDLFVPTDRDQGQRLDAYLSRLLDQYSRSFLKKMILEGRILVNDQTVRPRHEIKLGDRVLIRIPTPKPSAEDLIPEPMPLNILFEDEDILVVNKASGIIVHPGAGREQGTLVHGLLAHCSRLAMQGAPQRPGVVHRLDRDTSGAMVVAKNEKAYLNLVDQFKQHQVEKEYLTLVYGSFRESSGEIKTSFGRHPTNRKKMAVLSGSGREAITRWRVKRQWRNSASLLLVTIETGRTHQIRVHLSHLSHPVVGDSTYGGGKQRARSVESLELRRVLAGANRQMLHAWRLSFAHPISQSALFFEATVPQDFSQIIEELDKI